jgi:hypothetical protein
MVDLNSLVGESGWTLSVAWSINNNGWIVGSGINPHGQYSAFLLTGVPEPSSMALAAIGIGGFAFRRVKRNRVRAR